MSVMEHIYAPLPADGTIRLCTILPDVWDQPLQCHLFSVHLSTNPSYSALSYVWGIEKDSAGISIGNNRIPAGNNLSSVLRRIRKPDVPLVVWVDAICINQADLEEKSVQVAMMGQIYSAAERVLVWLGEPAPGEYLPVRLIEKVCSSLTQFARSLNGVGFQEKLSVMSQAEIEEKFDIPQYSALDWVMLRKLLSSPYWSRSWTYQEVLLARESVLFYGTGSVILNPSPDMVEEANLAEFIWWLTFLSDTSITAKHLLSNIEARYLDRDMMAAEFIAKKGGLRSLFDILRLRRTCLATDARDKIYAYLNAVSDQDQLKIVPDYQSSVESVYTSVARRIILVSQNLDVLSLVEPLRLNGSAFPSWVPDWSHPHSRMTHISTMATSKQYTATGLSKLVVRDTGNSSELALRGIMLGRVTQVGSQARFSSNDESKIQIPEEAADNGSWWQVAMGLAKDGYYEPTRERMAVAFARTRVADSIPVINSHGELKEESFGLQIHINTIMRRFIITDTGYMGLGPYDTKEGDVVYLLLGGKLPFVLRQSGEKFNLVGECYFHGAVDGEIFIKEHERMDPNFKGNQSEWLSGLGTSDINIDLIEVILV